jgi:stress response protein YsnF
VNEEVRVGKRQVQTSQQVSDKVKHEELRIDKEGEVKSEENKPRGDRKGRVA